MEQYNNNVRIKKHVSWNNPFLFSFFDDSSQDNEMLVIRKYEDHQNHNNNERNYQYIEKNKKQIDDCQNRIHIENINCSIPKRHEVTCEPFHWIFQYHWNASNKLHQEEVFPVEIDLNSNQYVFMDLVNHKKWLKNKSQLEIEMLYTMDFLLPPVVSNRDDNNHMNVLFHCFLDLDELSFLKNKIGYWIMMFHLPKKY